MGGGSSSYGKIVPDTMEMDVAALLRIRKHWSWRLEDEIGWQDLKPSSDLREMPTLKPPEYGFMPLEGVGVDHETGRVVQFSLSGHGLGMTGGPIPWEPISHLFQLRVLMIGSNVLTGKINPCIRGLGKLEVLYLSDNRLEGMLPAGLGGEACCPHLRSLSINNNYDLGGELCHELWSKRDVQLNYFQSGRTITKQEPPINVDGDDYSDEGEEEMTDMVPVEDAEAQHRRSLLMEAEDGDEEGARQEQDIDHGANAARARGRLAESEAHEEFADQIAMSKATRVLFRGAGESKGEAGGA